MEGVRSADVSGLPAPVRSDLHAVEMHALRIQGELLRGRATVKSHEYWCRTKERTFTVCDCQLIQRPDRDAGWIEAMVAFVLGMVIGAVAGFVVGGYPW